MYVIIVSITLNVNVRVVITLFRAQGMPRANIPILSGLAKILTMEHVKCWKARLAMVVLITNTKDLIGKD
jgi:hypothetical protein